MARCLACGKYQKGPVVDDHVCNPPEDRMKPIPSQRELDIRSAATRLWLSLEELIYVTAHLESLRGAGGLSHRRGEARKSFVEAIVDLDRAQRRKR
jgi:hypothetical protein